jgi:hypothetical protein
MTLNVNGVARSYSLLKDYQNYIKVASEFLDWVYLTKEEKQFVDRIARQDKLAVEGEIDKIKRSLLVTGLPEEQGKESAYQAITSNKQQIDEIQKLLSSL